MKNDFSRRDFLAAIAAAGASVAGASVAGASVAGATAAPAGATAILPNSRISRKMTVQDVIDVILREMPGDPLSNTVDTLKAGDPSQMVTGVATTFLATIDVIERAAALGANFIITHEPTFYNHLDETDWLKDDEIYAGKRRLLEEHGIAVWRFHDYWHRYVPDGIMAGLLRRLEWDALPVSNREQLPTIVRLLPPKSLAEVAAHVREKLGIDRAVEAVGDPEMTCRTVGLLPGAYGGRAQIEFLGRSWVDVMIVGEINEWETSVYVEDAISSGKKTSLLILGHAVSEEAGMELLVDWLSPKIPGIPVHHVPSRDPFVLI